MQLALKYHLVDISWSRFLTGITGKYHTFVKLKQKLHCTKLFVSIKFLDTMLKPMQMWEHWKLVSKYLNNWAITLSNQQTLGEYLQDNY